MKFLKYALIIPILVGCNSKNNSIEVLKQNAKSYEEISNTVAYRSNNAIVYFTLYNKHIKVKLIDKSENEDLSITECKINKKLALIQEIKNQDLGLEYIIPIDQNKKKFKIDCKLNNSENIIESINRY